MKTTTFTLLSALAATAALAKTNLEGCTSSETVAFGGASMIYWDPTNGEICSFLDCGGGRAPPKTTVPGCGNYAGTATYTPDFMPGWGSATATESAAPAEETEKVGESGTESGYEVSVPASETATGASTLVTSKAVLPSTGTAVGTGGQGTVSMTGGANNVTGSATLSGTSTGAPAEATGAAARFGASVVGVVVGVFGLALL